MVAAGWKKGGRGGDDSGHRNCKGRLKFDESNFASCVVSPPVTWNCCVTTKDHIDEIDFQEPFFVVVNWPISEFYGAFVC